MDHVAPSPSLEIDVRAVPKAQRHPLIFQRFDALEVGESFVLVNSHDPKHLRQEFDRDHAGAYAWEYLAAGEPEESGSGRVWRIRISRTAAADLPRLLGDTRTVAGAGGPEPDAAGAVWKLEVAHRQLDANLIRLAPSGCIQAHDGPDLDVLMHVLDGSGTLESAAGPLPLSSHALVWLPRRSRRAISAGPEGLRYLTVHVRRPALSISSARHEFTPA